MLSAADNELMTRVGSGTPMGELMRQYWIPFLFSWEIDADGSISDVTFDYTPKQSSWLALRIYPTAHTNPVFVEVDGKPIRASKKSAQWCLDGVDVCWKQKMPRMRKEDLEDAKKAYDFAREAFRKILEESHVD